MKVSDRRGFPLFNFVLLDNELLKYCWPEDLWFVDMSDLCFINPQFQVSC
jgi:hypothetical protein